MPVYSTSSMDHPTTPSLPSVASTIHYLRFNQDCTSLAVGTSRGYNLYSLSSALEKLDPIHTSSAAEVKSKVKVVERLFSSSLVALVTQDEPRKLKVCHFKKGTDICGCVYNNNTILAVKLNRARVVVCVENELFIHNIRDMHILHTIKDTPPNPRGLVALSFNCDNCFLAYPGSNTTGEVQLFDAFNLQAKIMIAAHDSPLAALAFNPAGDRLATASEKGTVIRVFSVEDGSKLFEFRRGVRRCATIYCMSFSQDSHYLVLSSNTETIHVFRMQDQQQAHSQAHHAVEDTTVRRQSQCSTGSGGDDSWMGYFSNAVSLGASYLPTQVTDTLNQTRSFATVTVPNANYTQGTAPNTVAIATISRQLRLLLASSDGYLYIYDLPGDEGGECILIKQHRIDLSPVHSNSTENLSGDLGLGVERSDPKPIRDDGHAQVHEGGSCSPASLPAVLKVNRPSSHSPPSLDESPPPTMQRPEI